MKRIIVGVLFVLLTFGVWQAVTFSQERPVLVDRFLNDATEVDVDAISDGKRVVICLSGRGDKDVHTVDLALRSANGHGARA